MNIRTFSFIALAAICASCADMGDIIVKSPDKRIKLILSDELQNGLPGFIIETEEGHKLLRTGLELKSTPDIRVSEFRKIKSRKKSVSNSWINYLGERREVPDNYNQLILLLESDGIKMNLIFRVYDEGAAFAWEFPEQEGIDSLTIIDEKIRFSFMADHYVWSAPRAQAQYSRLPLSKIDRGCERPLVIEIDSVNVIALAEANLVDYARMKFEPDSSSGISISTRLAGEVKKALPFQSPWRVIMVGSDPGDLLEKNYLILNLNDPCEIGDISWIRPGKVLREVTLTTNGAKDLIDFIARHNMQYIEFDAGWYGHEYADSSDARFVNVDPARSKGPLDMQEIIRYAHSRDVGVLLYVNRRALEKQLDELLPLYSRWGISGLKFGFVQVGTQPATAWMHEAIRKAAGYKMIVDVHDEYRPTGYSRTYPNFLTQEGIRGDEESPSNSHTLITMFTRMIAGAGDNTICYYDNRVKAKMGSNASQLAKAVCIFSPLQFIYWYDKTIPAGKENELTGRPNYLGDEPELEFFDNVPTVWDETKVLHARIGEYGVIARRKGDEWFIGAINGEENRTLDISFSFLEKGIKYQASVYSDDHDVKSRTQVRIDRIDIDRNDVYKASLGSNSGTAMHIVPVKK